MQLAHSTFREFQRNKWFLPPAVILGIGFGLFVSGYWLIDLLPAGSRQLLILTGLSTAVATVGYYLLLSWAKVPFLALSLYRRFVFAGVGLLAGIVLLFGGTSQWLSSTRYVAFLLPSHNLQILVKSGDASPRHLALIWFKTSLGDVSYSTIDSKGWKREGDQLVLENPADNSLTWDGKTGQTVELLFQGVSSGEKLMLAWDGNGAVLSATTGKINHVHTFEIPWYASGELVLGLGILISTSLALGLALLLWERRKTLIVSIEDSLHPAADGLGIKDAALIVGMMLLAIFLRLPNLGRLFPAVDEYYHLIAARQILEGVALSSVYERGLWLVTLPVALSMRVFGTELWAARLTGVLFNVLAILPLYLLTSKINRPVAVLSAGLYATSPWIVTFARIAREYAYYPFYFFWIIYGMVFFVQGVPREFVLLRQWRDLIAPKMILVGLCLLMPPIFVRYGDRLSTFRTILIAYVVFAVFLLSRFRLRDRMNWLILALLGGSMLAVSYTWYQQQKTKILPYPKLNPLPVEYFLPNPQQQWYFDRVVIIIVLGLLGAALAGYIVRRFNIVPLLLFVLYSSYLAIFALFSKTFFHTRHVLTTELWYIVVMALGLYIVWKVIEVLSFWKGRFASVVLAVVVGLSVINVRQVLLPITATNPDNPISQDYLHDFSQVHEFMLTHVQPHDVLISTVYGLYSSWQEAPKFELRYRITSQTPRQDVFSIIDQHESGWIVVDQIRLELSSLGPRDFADSSDIKYMGLFGDQYVWHWQHSSGSFGNTTVPGKGQ